MLHAIFTPSNAAKPYTMSACGRQALARRQPALLPSTSGLRGLGVTKNLCTIPRSRSQITEKPLKMATNSTLCDRMRAPETRCRPARPGGRSVGLGEHLAEHEQPQHRLDRAGEQFALVMAQLAHVHVGDGKRLRQMAPWARKRRKSGGGRRRIGHRAIETEPAHACAAASFTLIVMGPCSHPQ